MGWGHHYYKEPVDPRSLFLKFCLLAGHAEIFHSDMPPEIVSISFPFQEAAVDLSYNGPVISNKCLSPLLMAFLNHTHPEQARLAVLLLSLVNKTQLFPFSPIGNLTLPSPGIALTSPK